MSRNFFAATEHRAVTNTLKAAVFVVAFTVASLLSSSNVLANTAVSNGRLNINGNRIAVTRVVEERIQNVQPNVLQAITLDEIDFNLSLFANDLVVFRNIDDKLNLRFVSQTNLLESKASLASLAKSNVIDLEGSNAIDLKTNPLNSNIRSLVFRHLDTNQPKVNVISLLDVSNGVQALNSLQQHKDQEFVSVNPEAEEANRILPLAGPQRLTQLSKLSLIL